MALKSKDVTLLLRLIGTAEVEAKLQENRIRFTELRDIERELKAALTPILAAQSTRTFIPVIP